MLGSEKAYLTVGARRLGRNLRVISMFCFAWGRTGPRAEKMHTLRWVRVSGLRKCTPYGGCAFLASENGHLTVGARFWLRKCTPYGGCALLASENAHLTLGARFWARKMHTLRWTVHCTNTAPPIHGTNNTAQPTIHCTNTAPPPDEAAHNSLYKHSHPLPQGVQTELPVRTWCTNRAPRGGSGAVCRMG